MLSKVGIRFVYYREQKHYLYTIENSKRQYIHESNSIIYMQHEENKVILRDYQKCVLTVFSIKNG